MILSDLPYGETANEWDSVIDLDQMWNQYRQLIRPRGVIALTARCPFDKLLGMSNQGWLRYEWIWEKSRPTGFLNANRAPLKAQENVLIFYKELPLYVPQFTSGKPYVSTRRTYFDSNHGQRIGGRILRNPGRRYPRSVLRIASEGKTFHSTQKPVALFEYLVRTYTRPEDLVLDSCMGSGTTAIACLNSGRNFVGFELDKKYHRLAEARVRKRQAEIANIMSETHN